MKRQVIYLIACFTGIYGCEPLSKKSDDQDSGAKVAKVLKVDDPHAFVVTNFKDKLTSKGELPGVLSIDENGVVEFVGQDEKLILPSELIVASQTGAQAALRVNSQPMTLEEAKSISLAMCKVVRIEDNRLRDWFSNKKYEDILDSNCLQIGRVDEIEHSVEVRSSFEQDLPWRVLYEVSYSRH